MYLQCENARKQQPGRRHTPYWGAADAKVLPFAVALDVSFGDLNMLYWLEAADGSKKPGFEWCGAEDFFEWAQLRCAVPGGVYA